MTTKNKHFISIWFFIGALLMVYGVLILGVGIYELFTPAPPQVAMANLHAQIWWGILLIAIGGIYLVKFRPGRE